MTPPEKPEDTGAEPRATAERTTVIATAGKASPVDEPGEQADGGTPEEAATTTPPPWQRVAAEEPQPEHQDTTQHLPKPDTTGWPTVDEPATVTVERPIVTGTAAPRLFGEGGAPAAAAGDQAAPSARASLNLDGVRKLGSGGAPSALRRPGRGPRRANLQIKRFDPWSVLKLSLVLGVALFFVWLVAVGALYAVLDGMGVWDKLNGISSELLNANAAADTGDPLISAGRVFGIAAIIGAINIVLFSALATVGAFVYNVSADLAGGLEVTLAERE